MNIIYRIVWNNVTGQFVVASEFAKGKCKSRRVRNMVALILTSSMGVANAGLIANGVSQSYSGQDIVTSAAGDYGIQGVNAGGEMTFTGGSISTSGTTAYAVVASDQGSVNISGTQVSASGAGTHAIYVPRNASLTADNVTVNSGTGYGVYAETNSTVTFTNGSVTSGSRGLVAGGRSVMTASDSTINAVGLGIYANGATINGDRLIVNTSGRNGHAVYSNAAAGNISLKNSQVTTLGDYSNGLYAYSGTLVSEQNDVMTSGIDAHAVYATGTTGNLIITGGTITTTGANAAGIFANGGSRINADNLSINSSGAALSASGASTLDARNITLNAEAGATAISAVSGANISGISIQGKVANGGNLVAFDGMAGAANSVTLADSSLNVTGNGAIGINSINGNNKLTLTNTQLSAVEGSAITLQNGSALNLSLDESALVGVTLLDASATGTSAQVSASNGSVMTGDVNVDPAATTASSIALNDSQWTGSAVNLQTLTLENGSLWNMADSSSLNTLTLNGSTLSFDHSNGRSSTLTVNGDFNGTGGTLVMNTVLAGDDLDTDKLHVTGNTNGSTDVVINNAGGSGAQTLHGIELISVDGSSDGVFTQQGRIVAAAYDYHLARGEGADNKNWYLTSDVNTVKPVTPVTPGAPGVDPVVVPVEGTGGESGPQQPVKMIVRPEVGNYIANIAAANTLFNIRLQDRGGETQYVDALTGEKKTTSLWMRNLGGHQQVRDNSEQIKTETNRYGLTIPRTLAAT
ncbi:autotransporter outer membrane beta-barrel domain-containing protein [Enterobacter sp. CFBP8995]|nr:autotransporter outer membrane beta-barrel domain-containing protein [Enterobacter sp. CFBP8995]